MTNGLPWEDVMKDQTDIHIAALELQWQAREREFLARNTQLVERLRALEAAAREVKEHCETGQVTRAWVVKRLGKVLEPK